MIAITLLLLIVPPFLFLYLYIKHKYSYWAKLGVNGPTPSILKLGNLTDIQRQSLLTTELELLAKYGPVYGTYTGLSPTLTVAEPALIRQVLIKDFASFLNHRLLTTYHESVNNANFFSSDGQWKRLRTVTTPAFTTGKLKKALPLMNGCVDQLERYFTQLAASGEGVMKDTREVLLGFTIQTIASTSFGAQTGSNGDRSQVSPFVVNGLKLSDVPAWQGLAYFVMPKWFNALFSVKHPFNVDSWTFFISATKALLRERQRSPNEGAQSNLVQLLLKASEKEYFAGDSYHSLTASMETEFKEHPSSNKPTLSQTKQKTLSDTEIVSAAVGIFAAGFDTTALTISNLLYELALQPDIQERLFQELEAALAGLEVDSDAYYDTIMGPAIPYLDAVIKETLRKYPPLTRLERRCGVAHYTLGSIPLVKDQTVEIPTLAVHYSEAFYPEPFAFKPSRFLPENKHLLVSGAYLPFGDGPRNCIGMRYAYQEMKLCLSRILRRFSFQVTRETPKQLDFLPFKFVAQSQPIPLKVVLRSV